MIDPAEVKPGDRLARWVLAGSHGGGAYDTADLQALTVIRVNRKTYTVDTDSGTRLRVPHDDITGRADW